DNFMSTSRHKAQQAQNRENLTVQPKESLSTLTKATITIKNFLGGEYYFTTDEIIIDENNIYLIEAKHASKAKLPSFNDIKDGLLKMILYTNLEEVYVEDTKYNPKPTLRLTSTFLIGKITSNDNNKSINAFIKKNKFSKSQTDKIYYLFQEAIENDFKVIIENAE
ncbi:MAG: hypothetical protein ACOC2U_04550, partial [bacterium]